MTHKHIIFIPGKNPKPPEEEHVNILWRVLLEGVRRTAPDIVDDLSQHKSDFKITAWNYLYYHKIKDISRDLVWIDVLLNQHGPSEKDIEEASSTRYKILHIVYSIVDHLPFLLKLMSGVLQSTANEIRRYFQNENDIACSIRERLKEQLRPILKNNEKVLLIGHSLGSVIAYDALWELSHIENLPNKVDLFLTIGSPLGMNYVQNRVNGSHDTGNKKYPVNIKKWVNISAEGDITALDHHVADDFSDMKKLNLVDDIEDHCNGIYNYFRNEEGLNCHRSYGYLVNPVVGKVIADWWKASG